VALLMDLADDTKKEQRRPKNSHGQLWSQLLPKPKRENVFVCVHIIFFHTKKRKKQTDRFSRKNYDFSR
jgi:hypothetical protein